MTTVTPRRRERLRTATATEIKQVGRRLLVHGGPAAFSLRAIARDMGMTASAIYRYFPSLDALVSELRTDLYAELSAPVDAARTQIPADRPAERLAAMAHAFRRWSIAHPAEFSLMFGEQVPGVAADDDACCQTPDGVLSFCKAFLAELVVLWQHHPFQIPPPDVISDRFTAQLSPYLRELSDEHPVDVVYSFLSGWIRLYGMVSMEVFGHLSWAVTDAEALFETEITAFLHQLTSR
jgi:AcrR family transcriptional regulator